MLAGRGAGKLDRIPALVRLAVEMRALPARRVLAGLLRAWTPLHVSATGVALVLFVVHVVLVVGRRWTGGAP
jgi:hypothetical protein